MFNSQHSEFFAIFQFDTTIFQTSYGKKEQWEHFSSQMVKVHILEEAFLWNKFLYSQLSIFVQIYQFDMVLSCLNIGKYVAVLTTYSSDDMSKMWGIYCL